MKSEKWKQWTIANEEACLTCSYNNGKIYPIYADVSADIPAHGFCRCYTSPLAAIYAGEATINGTTGADWYLKYFKELPEYYITKKEAISLGWVNTKGNLSIVAPKKMLFGGKYKNRNNKLPDAPGRIWFEADINYTDGWRNDSRILFSNDGLLFVTYNHYKTFKEII